MSAAIVQEKLFDYDALNTETRIIVQQRAGEIKVLAKRVASDIVEIGGKLAEVKDRLGGNGRFNDWLSLELGWSDRTAYNFIAVYERFGSANFAIENIAPSALYLLVAPSTPEPARQAAVEMANQGERVTHKAAKVIVETAREAEPKTSEMFAKEVEVEDDEALELPEPEGIGVTVEALIPELGDQDKPSPVVALPEAPVESPKPVVAAVPAQPAGKPLDSAMWSQQQIVIGITLMPGDGDPRGRQAIVSIRANDGPPVIQSKRLLDVPGGWPRPIDEMIEAFAFKLVSEGEPKSKSKSVKKTAKKGAKK